MDKRVSRTDFEWDKKQQSHESRRKIILKKYPQIKKLFGHDPKLKWVAGLMVLAQMLVLFIVKKFSWPWLIGMAYFFGGTLNSSLMFALHETSHNMAFGHSRPRHNRILGFIFNLPIGIPMSISFRKYHLEHHRYLGYDVFDVDLPTLLEAKLFKTSFGKFIWLCLQCFNIPLRPLIVNSKPLTRLEVINIIIQITFDALVVYFIGWKAMTYLILGTMLGLGLHPMAAHMISEHFMFAKGFETYSYYGPLNWISFNLGYHNEHHDFPAVPGSRLPQVKKIAPEFYETMPQHTSWMRVIYEFIMDPSIGPYARIKRHPKD